MSTNELLVEIKKAENEINDLRSNLRAMLGYRESLRKQLCNICTHETYVREPDAGIDERAGFICKVCGWEK